MAPTTPTGSRRTSTGPMTPWRCSSNGKLGGHAAVVVHDHRRGEDLHHHRAGDRAAGLGRDDLGELLVARLDAPWTAAAAARPARAATSWPRVRRRTRSRAAATARSMSPVVASGVRPATSSVDALMTSMVSVPERGDELSADEQFVVNLHGFSCSSEDSYCCQPASERASCHLVTGSSAERRT